MYSYTLSFIQLHALFYALLLNSNTTESSFLTLQLYFTTSSILPHPYIAAHTSITFTVILRVLYQHAHSSCALNNSTSGSLQCKAQAQTTWCSAPRLQCPTTTTLPHTFHKYMHEESQHTVCVVHTHHCRKGVQSI